MFLTSSLSPWSLAYSRALKAENLNLGGGGGGGGGGEWLQMTGA